MKADLVLRGDGMAFDVALGEHRFVIDAHPDHGGEDLGPTPKPLVLAAVAGCAAMDVISILRKMRQGVTALRVSAEGRPRDEHPRIYPTITLTVDAEGDIAPGRLWRAVALSRDVYCGVSAMLRPTVHIRYVVRLNGAEIAEPEPAGPLADR